MARIQAFSSELVGKKVMMALTGLLMYLFIIFHQIANLTIFFGRDVLNDWAFFLDRLGIILWGVRLLLAFSLIWHTVVAFQVWLDGRRARPVGYEVKKDIATSYAARTMIWTGPLIFAYLVYHIAMFDFQLTGPGNRLNDIYTNVVMAFRVPWITGVYLAALVILGIHFYHGTWSMLHTFGISNPHYHRLRWILSPAVAAIISLGFILIPLAVITGFVG